MDIQRGGHQIENTRVTGTRACRGWPAGIDHGQGRVETDCIRSVIDLGPGGQDVEDMA